MRRLWALLPLAVPLCGQVCPPIGFVNLSEAKMIARSSGQGTGILRQPDGTFTGHTFSGTGPNYPKVGSTPNFDRNFLNCSAAAGKSVQSIAGRPNFGLDQLGTSARNPLISDFVGDGTSFSGVGTGRASPNQNQVYIVVANNDATARTRVSVAAGNSPFRQLAADLNGDGRRDIIVLNEGTFPNPGSLSVLLNNGGGTFAAAVNTNLSGTPATATTIDFNGDNRPDIAVAMFGLNGAANSIQIFLNNGSGAFTAGQSLSGGASGLIAADVTGDGRPDLIAGFSQQVTIYGGNGDGTFRLPVTVATDFNANSIASGDLNKDGRVDLVTVDRNSMVATVLLGAGNGRYPTQTSYSLGASLDMDMDQILVMDFDGDTHLDIVAGAGHPDALTPAEYDSSIKVLFNRGDGSFIGAPVYKVGATAVIKGDVNGDGKIDILSVASQGVRILYGMGGGSFQKPVTPLNGAANGIAAADWNGDGKLDVAWSSGNNLRIALGNGNGSFQTPAQMNFGTGLYGLASGDINGDGRPDLIVGQEGNTINSIFTLLANANGTFQNPVTVTACNNPKRVYVSDLNSDSKLDIVAVCEGEFGSNANPGGIGVLLGNGNGTFQNVAVLPSGVNPSNAAMADVTGDGKPELFVSTTLNGNGTYRIAYFANQGNGSFQAAQFLATDFGPSDIVVGDYSGDGKPDLIVAHCCGETDAGFYIGNGGGAFQSEVLFGGAASASLLLSHDLNSDGKLDLITMASGGGADATTVLMNLQGPAALPGCGFTMSQASGSAGAGGETLGTFVIASDAGCVWNASTTDSWITLSKAQGTGSGSLTIRVAANATATERTGTVAVAGLVYTVKQVPTGCNYTLTPQTSTISSDFTFFDINVATGANCAWTAVVDVVGTWLFTSTIGPGSKPLSMAASNNTGNTARLASVSVGGTVAQILQQPATPLQVFTDVPTNDGFFGFISALRNAGITSGCTNTTYCPNDNTTRGQMAVFIVRSLFGGDTFPYNNVPYFTDVPANHPFFAFIQKMKELGITSGCTATTYCANDPVTRAQMATFIVRAALGLASGDALVSPSTPFFTDVPANNVFFPFVQKMKQLGITAGCTATTYCPDTPVTRGQMAVFITRGL